MDIGGNSFLWISNLGLLSRYRDMPTNERANPGMSDIPKTTFQAKKNPIYLAISQTQGYDK